MSLAEGKARQEGAGEGGREVAVIHNPGRRGGEGSEPGALFRRRGA